MAAWTHSKNWSPQKYLEYRKFVSNKAEDLEGTTDDCADISMSLLLDFAADNELPVTFYDNAGVRYISKATGQVGGTRLTGHRNLTWKNKTEYTKAVKDRIGSKSLFTQNMEPNPNGPEPGDLMISRDHTALVYRVTPAGMVHPLASKFRPSTSKDVSLIPLFPGDVQATHERSQTQYFRTEPEPYGPIVSQDLHFDYLNHRGSHKPEAELIMYASGPAMKKDGFQFKKYRRHVLDNWNDWDGKGDPPASH